MNTKSERQNLLKANDLEIYRREALRAARGLYYNPLVVQRIKDAKSESDIEHIMNSARRRYL